MAKVSVWNEKLLNVKQVPTAPFEHQIKRLLARGPPDDVRREFLKFVPPTGIRHTYSSDQGASKATQAKLDGAAGRLTRSLYTDGKRRLIKIDVIKAKPVAVVNIANRKTASAKAGALLGAVRFSLNGLVRIDLGLQWTYNHQAKECCTKSKFFHKHQVISEKLNLPKITKNSTFSTTIFPIICSQLSII